jgi:hypothetical protein
MSESSASPPEELFWGTLPAGLEQKRFERLLEHLDDILFLFNREGVCLACCTYAHTLLFAPADQFIGRPLEDYLKPELARPVREHLEAYLNGEPRPPLSYAAPDYKSWYQLIFIGLPDWPDYPIARIRHITEQHLFAKLFNPPPAAQP